MAMGNATNRDRVRIGSRTACLAIFLAACTTAPVTRPSALPAAFAGEVRDNLDQPVAGAQVTIAGVSTRTESDGSFRLTAGAEGPYAMVVEHRDFAYYSRTLPGPLRAGTFRLTRASRTVADPTRRIVLRDERRPEDCVAVPSLPEGRLPCGPGFGIDIPANSLVDAEGNPPAGPVEVKLATFEIHTESMPGPFLIAASDRDVTTVAIMRPYGAGSVEVRDAETGRELNLAPGRLARIDIPVHPMARLRTGEAVVPDTIPLLRFDRDMLRWVRIGTMPLAGESYSAQVSQLTTFNADTDASFWGCLNIQFWGTTPTQIVNPIASQVDILLKESNQPFIAGTGAVNAAGGATLYNMFFFKSLGSGNQIIFDQHVAYSLESAHYYWGQAFNINNNTLLTDNTQAQSVYLFTQNPLHPPLPAPGNVFMTCMQMNLYWDDKLNKEMPGSWRDYDYLSGPITFNRPVQIIRSLEEPTVIGRIPRGTQVFAIGVLRERPWLLVRTERGETGLAPREGADLSRTRTPERALPGPGEVGRQYEHPAVPR